MIPRFRCWHKKEKKMVHHKGGTFKFYSDGFWCFKRAGKIIIENGYGILMQSTGFKDKNGKEIFEGDVIEQTELMGTKFYHIVNWDKNKLQWRFGSHPLHTVFKNKTSKLIGNIHENPELLKK